MKKLLFSIILGLGMAYIPMTSNAIELHKKKGPSGIDSSNVNVKLEKCKIDQNGIVRDVDGLMLGTIDKNGIITDAQNVRIGKRLYTDSELISNARRYVPADIDSSNVRVRLENSSIDQNGIVKDKGGLIIGTIDKNDIITDEQHVRVGIREKTDTELITNAYLL